MAYPGKPFSYFFMKTCCRYSLEGPWQGTSNEYYNISFHGEIIKVSKCFGWKNVLPGIMGYNDWLTGVPLSKLIFWVSDFIIWELNSSSLLVLDTWLKFTNYTPFLQPYAFLLCSWEWSSKGNRRLWGSWTDLDLALTPFDSDGDFSSWSKEKLCKWIR